MTMHYAGRRRSETNPLASIPLYRPASILRPFEPLPSATPANYRDPHTAPSEQELRRHELANAEAALDEAMRVYNAARADIGKQTARTRRRSFTTAMW